MTAPTCSGCLPEGLYGLRTPLPPRSVSRRGARESRQCFSLLPCFAQGRSCAVIGEGCPAGRGFANSFSATLGCGHAGCFLWPSLRGGATPLLLCPQE